MNDLARVVVASAHDIPVIRIVGEVDLSNAEEIEEALLEARADAPGLVVDLGEASYLDSAGIRLLFRLVDRVAAQGHRLRVVVPGEAAVRRVLLVAGLDRVVPFDQTLEDALAGLRVPV